MPIIEVDHYLTHITELGDSERVVVHEDIRNRQGLKLLAKGTPVNRQVLDRLLHHKLLKPIDLSITIADALDSHQLAFRAQHLSEEPTTYGSLLRQWRGRTLKPSAHFRHLPLNHLLTNKLTVMQKRLPRLLDHSVRVAEVAVALGSLCGLGWDDLSDLAAAGVFHDIGELHIDPTLIGTGRVMTETEWQQIHVHPRIGYLILQAFPEYHPRLSRPVLEHHERLDGSGYPSGLTGNHLSRLSRIVAVAEVVTAVVEKNSIERLDVVLKSQQGKLDPELSDLVYRAVRHAAQGGAESAPPVPLATMHRLNTATSQLIADWTAMVVEQDLTACPCCSLLALRMAEIQRLLLSAGNSTDWGPILSAIEGDSDAYRDLANVLHESLYRIRQAIHEARLCSDDFDRMTSSDHAARLRGWIEKAEQLLPTAV